MQAAHISLLGFMDTNTHPNVTKVQVQLICMPATLERAAVSIEPLHPKLL